MSIKIESSVEEVKNWISAGTVYDVLSAFGIIEVDEFDSVGENQRVSLTQNEISRNTRSVHDIKVNLVFENKNKDITDLKDYLVEAA